MPLISSARYYQLIVNLLSLLPLRRYAVATWLMSRSVARLTAPVRAQRGRWVVVPNAPSSWVPAFGLKEPAVHYHLAACLRHADAFVDCGANLGWYSFLASRQPGVRSIIAVEPVARSSHYIELVRQINRLERLQILRGCIATSDGPTAFSFTSGSFSEHGHVAIDGQITHSVPGYTLETVLAQLDPALRSVCLKIDVEGYERLALTSLHARTMRERVGTALVEVHLASFDDPSSELRAICALLAPVGELRFIISTPRIDPGYKRLLWHLSGRYPLHRLSIEAAVALVERHGLEEIFVLARRKA